VTLDQGLAFSILGLALVLFAWGKWRYDIVAAIALVAVAITGLVEPGEIFSGFGHPAVITVAAVLVISHTLRRVGVIDVIASGIAPFTKGTFSHIASLSLVVAVCSAFMNNVGAIAIMLPVALASCAERDRSPAIILMPLAFGSILGGLMTMIGTPPNIIIATYRAELKDPVTGLANEPFGMFAFSPVGVPVAIVGLMFVALIGWRLIPKERRGTRSPEDLFEISHYITEVRVPEGSKLIGISMQKAEEMTGEDVAITGITRNEGRMRRPVPWELVREGDLLLMRADPKELKPIVDDHGLELVGTTEDAPAHLAPVNTKLIETVVTPGSSLEGRSSHYLRWRSGFSLELLGVAREGEPLDKRIKRTEFRAGDVLLLQAAEDEGENVLGELGLLPLPERGLALGEPRRVYVPLGIFALAIAAAAFGILPIAVSFIAAILAYVILGILPLRELYTKIDWPIIVLLGGMIPVGRALEASGGTALIADGILSLTGTMPPWAILTLVMIVTMTLSDLINNAATALIMAPIAVAIAAGLGVSYDPFLMAVAIGASCAFLTPIGHQSNTLVMGPGGYRFGDYWRMGLPLEIAIVVVSVPLILVIWPM
jgi:di/tricarboxylate transporter